MNANLFIRIHKLLNYCPDADSHVVVINAYLIYCIPTFQLKIRRNFIDENYSIFFVLAVVVSLYEDPIQPQQAASVVEKLGDYLITCGY